MVDHVTSIRPLIDALKAGPAKLNRLEVHGPQVEVLKLKGNEAVKSLKVEYYESADTSKRIKLRAQHKAVEGGGAQKKAPVKT
jgi:hypothetical protein